MHVLGAPGRRQYVGCPRAGVDNHDNDRGATLPERQAGTVTRMSEPLKLTVVYEDGDDGWIMAQVAEVPAAVSQGRTREEARANVLDALRLVLAPEQAVPADRSEALEFTLRR